MYKNVKNVGTKSKLSKLLAMENITVINKPGAQTASFDVRQRQLTMPVWDGNMSVHLYDMLTIHEVGHALDTKYEDWKEAQEKLSAEFPDVSAGTIRDFLNVIEDVRIDKRQKRRYPGCRRDYALGYKELWEREFFGVSNSHKANKMLFIDRINIHYKAGVASGIKFSKSEQTFINRLDNIDTWNEVVQIVRELLLFCAAETLKKMKFEHSDLADEFGTEFDGTVQGVSFEELMNEVDEADDEDEDLDNEDLDDEDEEENFDIEEDTMEFDHEEDFDDEEEKGEESKAESEGGSNEFDEDGEIEEKEIDMSDVMGSLKSETSEKFESAKKSLIQNVNADYFYFKLPEKTEASIAPAKLVHSRLNEEENFKQNFETWQTELNQYRRDEMATISFMVKEFEMKKRAKQYSRTRVSRTGMLDMNKLHAYKTSEDIFLQREILADSKNHGFVMIIDWSSSMTGVAHRVMKQTITMMLFCQKLQIPFEVYLFRDARVGRDGYDTEATTTWKDYDVSEESFNGFLLSDTTLRQLATSSMSKTELNMAMRNMWGISRQRTRAEPMTGTPLLEAIHLSKYVVKDFQKRHNPEVTNLIFLTDGEGSGINWIAQSPGPDTGRQKIVHLQDDETKQNYRIGRGYASYNEWEKVLMGVVRETTGANIIGFYVTDGYGSAPKYLRRWLSSDTDEVQKNKLRQFRNENYFTCRKTGYDTFFVLNGSAMNIRHNDQLDVEATATQHKIAKMFSKYQSGKKFNRVMLKNFVDQISK